ncbi:MAG: ABC transporter ATP-binding protein [Caldimicrobium sp.]|nr:ABC transporter ATP-binding protein [Caldimicrobium sp.]MCX7613106.1 ABC transporter ATP-binding protein [Caldimicrobium sp.]MDW8183061.1 ABC transporter ATP-binding protein [Caldimicrobium sp.]
MSSLLKVENLWKAFYNRWVLRNISFEIKPSDILGIIGPNGAGKSTLLYILLGIISPTKGKISYFGRDFYTNRSAILEKVGFASHYVGLPYSLTVEENLRVFARLYRVKDIDKTIDNLLETFKLKDKRKVLTRTLSSGEMMRLNLIRATLPQPKILLLDEPTAGLDPEFIQHVRIVLKEKAEKEALSIILTSHQLGELERIINKVLLLDRGEIKGYGSLKEVFQLFKVDNLEDLYFKVFKD